MSDILEAAPESAWPQPAVVTESSSGPLAHIPLFSLMGPAEQTELLASMERTTVQANEPIFWFGDKGEDFFLIQEGQVAITVPNAEGEHLVLNYLSAGGFFGEISLLDGGRRTASVRATQDTTLYRLGRRQFHEFLRRHPDVAIEVLTVMGRRQREVTDALRGMPNANTAFEQTRVTLWQKFSDMVARVSASQYFTLLHVAWFGSWISANLLAMVGWAPFQPWDPFPFGLLTMVVSLEAIFLAIFVMVSQSRQSEKDRIKADLDYRVNVKAQTEIMSISRRLERIEQHLIEIGEDVEDIEEARSSRATPVPPVR